MFQSAAELLYTYMFFLRRSDESCAALEGANVPHQWNKCAQFVVRSYHGCPSAVCGHHLQHQHIIYKRRVCKNILRILQYINIIIIFV